MQTQETTTRRLAGWGTNGSTNWSRRGKVRLTLLTTLSLAALAGLGQSAHAQSSYTVTDLGRLPGSDRSYPNNVDASDPANVKVVGTTLIGGGGIGSYAYHGFYWSSATKTMVDIGVIGAGTQSRANDVNSKGEVVGDSSTVSGNGNNHALYWSPSRGAGRPLDLCPEWPASNAYNINENGIVFGDVYSQSTGTLPACWIPSAPGVYGTTVLLPQPSGTSATNNGYSRGRRLAENGDIVARVVDAGGNSHAAYWKNTGTSLSPIYGLPTLIVEPSGAVSSGTSIINNRVYGVLCERPLLCYAMLA